MNQIRVEGNRILTGKIDISGAKNSAVALVPAALLSDEKVLIENIPEISDIDALNEILVYLGADVKREKGIMEIDPTNLTNKVIPEEIAQKLRASYYFMAALLGKYKKVELCFPGGCSIGARPIDQTLKAFKNLGAKVEEYDNKYIITADELIGAKVYLDMPSVGATVNTMLAAVKAKGKTIIENAAKEPEIVNVATFLNNMGAKITGAGTSEIKITGVDYLKGGYIEVIPDRIEAGTYLLLGAMMGENLKINNIIPKHLEAVTDKLKEMGLDLNIDENSITISRKENLNPVSIKTLGYPGFPTDLQQPFTTLLTKCKGTSKVEETIYESRFKNTKYLKEMGANIEQISEKVIKVHGPTNFIGKDIVATDLRGGACVLIAALSAKGESTITNIEHLLRGYERIVEKLESVGAKITIEQI